MKPRRVSSATASASPSAICIVVLVVGARPIGQASAAAGSSSATSAACASVSSARAVIADQRQAEAARMRDQVGQLRGLAGVGQRQHRIARHDHAEIAVRGLGRVDEQRGRAGGGEGGGDLARRHGPTCPCRRPRRGRRRPPAGRRRGRSRRPARRPAPQPGGLGRSTARATSRSRRGRGRPGSAAHAGGTARTGVHRQSSRSDSRSDPSCMGNASRRGQSKDGVCCRFQTKIMPSAPQIARNRRGSVRENIRLLLAEQIQPAARRQEGEAGLGQLAAGPRAPAAPPASPTARADAARRTRRRPAARRDSSGAPQSEVCCCLDSSTPSSSRHRSFSPCRSVKVRTSLAAILVQFTGRDGDAEAVLQHGHVEAGEMHQLDDVRVGQQRLQVGAVVAVAAERGGTICTRCACPSPAESCTRHSRSRCGSSPMVSVSTATTGPSVSPSAGRAGADGWCRWA